MASTSKSTERAFFALAVTRIGLGLVFLWAFFDKLLGLGFSTCRDPQTSEVATGCARAWVEGGSPTTGFLANATQGPFADFYQSLAGQGWVDWMFMGGLLVIGLGLTLGIWVKIASLAGILMMFLMWTALLWPENHPFIDDHVIYALILVTIYYANSQQKLGLRAWWTKTNLVARLKFLE